MFFSVFFNFHLENIQLLHFQTSFIHQGRRLVWAECFKSLRWPAAVLILELESLCLLWSWSQLSQSLWSTKVKSRWRSSTDLFLSSAKVSNLLQRLGFIHLKRNWRNFDAKKTKNPVTFICLLWCRVSSVVVQTPTTGCRSWGTTCSWTQWFS